MDMTSFINSILGYIGSLAKLGDTSLGIPNWIVLAVIYALAYFIWDQTVGQWTKPITILIVTFLIGSFLGLI